jgi:hypothetical protein
MPANDAKTEAEQKKIKQAEALKAKQEALKHTKASKQERANDTRRKILAGSVLMSIWDQNPEYKAKSMAMLNRFLTRDKDRALFDLPPIQQQTPS